MMYTHSISKYLIYLYKIVFVFSLEYTIEKIEFNSAMNLCK